MKDENGKGGTADPRNGLTERFCEDVLQLCWETTPRGTRYPLGSGGECEVLFPGIRNGGKGPDFRDAVIRIGGAERKGAVEIHCRTTDWIRHGHGSDPAYGDVILHAVGTDDSAPSHLSALPHVPLIVLKERKDISVESGQTTFCASFFSRLPDDAVVRFLQSAGLNRLRRKSDLFLSGTIREGTARTSFLFLMDLLGLPSCRPAFRQIARRVCSYPDAVLRKHVAAVLWGESGLLPDPAASELSPEADALARALWSEWWKLRNEAVEPPVFGVCRPLDSPCRRIACAAALMTKTGGDPAETFRLAWEKDPSVESLHDVFKVSVPFWENHSGFAGPALHRRSALPGEGRIRLLLTDFAFPALHAVLRMRKDAEGVSRLEKCYFSLPGNPDNGILRRMRSRCFPGREMLMRSAACQQGMIGLHHEFCRVHSFLCSRCPFRISLRGEN